MTERDALLRAILEQPDDDTPRLVYADWLDEHVGKKGKARAEFVRLQCRIPQLLAVTERWAATPSDRPGGTAEDGAEAGAALAEAQILERRERALLRKWGRGWLPGCLRSTSLGFVEFEGDAAYFRWDNIPAAYARFARGFVSAVGFEVVNHTQLHPTSHFPGHVADTTRDVLASQPCGTVTCTWHGWEPDVVLRFHRTVNGMWKAGVQPVAGDLMYVEFDHRRGMLAGVHELLATAMPAIEFERVRDDDNGDYDDPDYGTDSDLEREWETGDDHW